MCCVFSVLCVCVQNLTGIEEMAYSRDFLTRHNWNVEVGMVTVLFLVFWLLSFRWLLLLTVGVFHQGAVSLDNLSIHLSSQVWKGLEN